MSADFDDRWLDVDFSKQPQFVFGCTGIGEAPCTAYGDEVRILSESEIRDAVEKETAEGGGADRLVTRIYDQKQEGSCVANACCQSNEVLQALQHGKDNVVHLSAISLYKRIGSSPGSGAMVSDGIKEMTKRGVLPLDTPENRAKFGDAVMTNTGFYEKYPANWEATAVKLAAIEFHTIRSVAELRTALVNGHPVVVGRQGHSICYVRLMIRGGQFVYKYANSWSAQWADNGFGYDSERQGAMSAQYCFAVRSVRSPSLSPA